MNLYCGMLAFLGTSRSLVNKIVDLRYKHEKYQSFVHTVNPLYNDHVCSKLSLTLK